MAKKIKGVSDHPNREDMKALWLQGHRAAYIVSWLEARCLPMVKRDTIESYGRRYWNPLINPTITVTLEDDEPFEVRDTRSEVDRFASTDEEDVRIAQELIEQVASSGMGTVKSVKIGSKEYPIWKREEGDEVAVSDIGSTRMRTVEVVPSMAVGLQRTQRTEVDLHFNIIRDSSRGKPSGWKLGVFLPDMQIGYFDNGKKLITTHDEAAIDVAHQMMAQAEEWYGIDCVVNAGDNLDLPAFGSHRSAPGYMTTTQNALTRASEEAAIQRAIAREADIYWIEGNHEQRLTNFLIDKAPQLLGVGRVPVDGEEEPPVNSVPFLCRFEEYGINWVGPYPDGEVWINDHLRFEHGRLYGSATGATAPKYLKDGVSVGFGHIHRSEMVQETRHTPRGPRTHFAGSPGCLCRLDSKVPSAKTGIDATGEQSGKRVENWQQGIWFFWYEETGRQFVRVDAVDIWGGWAMWEGIEFKASVDPNGDPINR